MGGERKPAIRFKEFNEDWEEQKFENIVDIRSGRDYKHLLDGEIPVYGTGGYMLSVNKALSYKEDAIGIGRKGTIDKPYILRAPFWTVDTLFYAVPNNNDLDFVYGIFQNIDWKKKDESTGVPSLSKPAINVINVLIPKEKEQTNIGCFFNHLDTLITLNQLKLKKLQNIKKSMLEKMFPKNGENVPEIRFKGFTDSWEQRRLGDLYQKIRNAFVGTATPYYVNDGHFYLESNNVKDGQINRNAEIFINDEFYLKQKDNWLHTGDLVMVQSGHVGHSAVIPEELNNTAAHALIIIANSIERTDPYFMNYQFQTKNTKNGIDNITTGNTIKHILSSEMKKFSVYFPKYKEQQKIGTFFRNLDTLITLQQRKLKKLQSIKKSMLEKMFI